MRYEKFQIDDEVEAFDLEKKNLRVWHRGHVVSVSDGGYLVKHEKDNKERWYPNYTLRRPFYFVEDGFERLPTDTDKPSAEPQ